LHIADIATIVVTHIHPDHFGLAGNIKRLSPRAQLLTHRWESDLIESRYIKFAELWNKIGAMLQRHGVPFSNMSALQSASMPALKFVTVTFPDLQKRFAVMETIAHLECMRWEGTVRRVIKGNSILYGLGGLTN
jgi:ribonuclease BN (tRNA processing enzyme)